MYTQKAISDKSTKMDEACQKGLFKGVKCCVLAAKCTEPMIVTVPVHPGYEEDTRNVDLYVDEYILPKPRPEVYLKHLDDHGVCIRSMPNAVRRKERWFWTIFTPYSERDTQVSEPWNNVYDSFKAGDGTNAIKGNIVVVKADNKGKVCDVQEKDLGHIEWIVYQFLETVADKGVMTLKHTYNPLLKQFERASPHPWGF